MWTGGDGDLGNGYYFKNGFRSFQYYPTTTTMNVYSATDCTGVNYGTTLSIYDGPRRAARQTTLDAASL